MLYTPASPQWPRRGGWGSLSLRPPLCRPLRVHSGYNALQLNLVAPETPQEREKRPPLRVSLPVSHFHGEESLPNPRWKARSRHPAKAWPLIALAGPAPSQLPSKDPTASRPGHWGLDWQGCPPARISHLRKMQRDLSELLGVETLRPAAGSPGALAGVGQERRAPRALEPGGGPCSFH